MSRLALRLAPLVLSAACATTSVSEVARPVPKQPSPAVAEQVERVPVPAPQSLVMLLRAARPEKSWRALASVYSLPVDLANELEGPSAGAGTFIDFAESVELAVFVAPQSNQGVLPQLSAVVSLPLKPNTAEFLEFVAKKGATVERTERTRIARDEQVCELWAEGEHASRLLCSNSEPTLREVGPWLSSTALPKPSEDLQLSLDFAPLNADLKPKLTVVLNEQLGLLAGELVSPVFKEPPMSAKLVSGGQQLLAGLNDLGTLQASLRLDEGTGRIALNAELQYRSKESWLTRLWADDLRQGPPPGIFMQLPKDSEGAFFGRGFQQSQFVEPRAFIEHAWTKGIELLATQSDGRMRAADARSFAALIPALPHLDGEWAWAFGSVPVTLAKPASVPPTPQEEVQQFEARYRQALGWSVFAVGGEPKELLTFFERGIDAVKRFAAIRKAEADRRLRSAPSNRKAALKAEREALDRFEPKFRVSRNPMGYPKGSALIEVQFGFDNEDLADPLDDSEAPVAQPQAKKAVVRGSLPLFIAIIPDGAGRYLWGLSADPGVLKSKLLASQRGAPASETLAARSDLGLLLRDNVSGGFASVAELVRRLSVLGGPAENETVLGLLSKLGDKGNHQLVFAVGGNAGDRPALTLSVLLE